MIPVDQIIMDKGRGDCVAACLASMLEVPLTAVPNFSDAPAGLFHPLYNAVLYGYGYILGHGTHPKGTNIWHDKLSIGGCFKASVPSRNFEGVSHAVVIDMDGLVLHDPSPNKNYQDENIFESGECMFIETYHKRDDDMWRVYQDGVTRREHDTRKNHGCSSISVVKKVNIVTHKVKI